MQSLGLAQLAAAATPQQQAVNGAPPSVQNPGGLGPGFDQLMSDYQVVIDAVDKLSKDLQGVDDVEAASVGMMASKLRTMRVKRQQALQQSLTTLQGASGPNAASAPGPGY